MLTKLIEKIIESNKDEWFQKVAEACDFIKKETLAQVFPCEFCEISRNSFSYRTPPMAASSFSGIYSAVVTTEPFR